MKNNGIIPKHNTRRIMLMDSFAVYIEMSVVLES
jgi:hypothetical protein